MMRPFKLSRLLVIISATTFIAACQTTAISQSDEQKLDHLLALTKQRLNIAPDVAKSKWNSGKVIDDPEREEQILNGVEAQAKSVRQCDAELARDFFEDQMEAGKIIQQNLFADWKNRHSSDYKFDDAHNLHKEIRPQLDKLTPALISAFCAVQSMIVEQGARQYVQQKAVTVIPDEMVRRQALNLFQTD